jgi:hypothetical protein
MLGNNPDGKVPNARKQAKSKIMRQKSFVSSSFVSPSDIASIRFQQKERTKLHEDVNRGARVTCVRLSDGPHLSMRREPYPTTHRQG